MKSRSKRILKITGISFLALLIVLIAGISLMLNFVFTPAKLTPVVLKVANQSLNARLEMETVELTFFSTFPSFGLKIKEGSLVSKAIRDTLWGRQDSLISFSECIVAVNPVAYLADNKISIHNVTLKDASVYAFINEGGMRNWDVMKASADTIVSGQDTLQAQFDSEIEIENVELKNTTVIFDDRDTKIYARIDGANLKLKLSSSKENSFLKLKFDNKNTLFWQQGELLVNKIATSLKTDIHINHPTFTWTLKDSELTINGIKLDANGIFVGDTLTKTVDIDMNYRLHTPSVETVLAMIPESVMKKNKVSAKGEVKVEGVVKGLYGDKKLPSASLKIQVIDASAKYTGFQYGIDHLSTDFEAFVDLMRNKPSFLNLKILHLKGAHTEVIADAKVENLLADPRITFNTRSTVDLDALAKTFPLQDGIIINGKLNADLKLKCRLSSLLNQDIGRLNLNGKLNMNDFKLRDTKTGFSFMSNASLNFTGDNTLQAQAQVSDLILKSKLLSSNVENLSVSISSTNPQDTTRIVTLDCSLDVNKLKAEMGDSVTLYCGKTKAEITLEPGKLDVGKPLVGLSFRTDSLFFRAGKSKLGLDVAGFDIHSEKVRDSVWNTQGIVGFNKMFFYTPDFGLPVVMKKTKVTLGNNKINLDKASLRMGRSNIMASGSVGNLYRAMTKNEMLKANLTIQSELIDCNQLINALSFPTDTLEEIVDTIPADLKLFIIPKNIDFEFQTNIKKVTYDKMVFENVYGAVDIKEQYVYLKNLSMRALDADMKTVVVYKASARKKGYAGFDFKIKDINVGKLVDFIPSLDTIVPMLRSFSGKVNFEVAAESVLDSVLNIEIPTLKSAIHIKGDSLVLMDGETFAEISKMLMFKNKKENMFDSISVNITVNDGNVTIYPFLVEIDRYKAAIGGKQGLDMNLDYHISILKSPLPFKAGVNITGNLDKMKFRIGKAKYKNAVTPVEIHKLDSTRMQMGNVITNRFKRIVR